MTIVDCIAALQNGGSEAQAPNTPGTGYFLIGLIAVVLGLVVWFIIRASARRSSKR